RSCKGFHCCDMFLPIKSEIILGPGQYHLAVAGGCVAYLDWSLRRTHPLPRGGTDPVQVERPHSSGKPLRGRERRAGFELHCVAISQDVYGLARQNFALQQFYCERILNQRLNRTLQRSCAVSRVVAFSHQELSC